MSGETKLTASQPLFLSSTKPKRMSELRYTITSTDGSAEWRYKKALYCGPDFDWKSTPYANDVAKYLKEQNKVITFNDKQYKLTAVLWNEVKKGDTIYIHNNIVDGEQMYYIKRVCKRHYQARDIVSDVDERPRRDTLNGSFEDGVISTYPSYELVATPYINIFQHIVLPPLTPKEELVYGVYRNTLDKFNKETIDVLKEIIDEKDDIINQLSDALRVADNKEMKFIKLYRRVEYTERIKWRIEQEQKDAEAL